MLLKVLLVGLMQLFSVDSICLYIKNVCPKAKSGTYAIWLPSGNYTVFCDMSTNRGGHTFIPKEMVAKMENGDVQYLFTKKQDVLLKILKTDGTQPYTILQSANLDVQLNGYNQYTAPINSMKPYIHLGTLLLSMSSSGNIEGFFQTINLFLFEISMGSKTTILYFLNLDNQAPSSYLANVLTFETQGLAVDWRNSAVLSQNTEENLNLPNNFFMLTEIYYGGCGVYTLSNRWLKSSSPAKGVAIGIR